MTQWVKFLIWGLLAFPFGSAMAEYGFLDRYSSWTGPIPTPPSISLMLQSEAEFDAKERQNHRGYGSGFHDPGSASALGWTEIERKLVGLDGPEAFLSYLGEREPGLFEEAILVYHSLSSQKDAVSPIFPRLIVHKNRLTLAMVTDPSHGKYREIEVIDTDPVTGQDSFRRITFSPPGSGARPTVEGDSKCLRCHGEHPRKIWSSYNLWPGFYGSMDGHMWDLKVGTRRLDNPERPLFEKFLENLPNNPRARQFAPKDGWNAYYQPLAAATSHFSELNGIRILHELRAHPGFYTRYKFAIYAALVDCPNFLEVFPASLRRQHESNLGMSFPELVEETRQIAREEYQAKRNRFLGYFGLSPDHQGDVEDPAHNFDEEGAGNVAQLRFIVEGQSATDIDMANWSMSFDPRLDRRNDSYNFGTGSRSGLHDFFRKTFWPAAQRDPELSGAQTCEGLKRKSLDALTGL